MTKFASLVRWPRRTFLRALGIATGGLLFAQGCREDEAPSEPRVVVNPNAPLTRVLRRHFHYLEIDDAVFAAFARDLAKHQGPWRPKKSPPPFSRFLASTDFFQNGADESRALTYVSYYDPYVSPCYNPFAPAQATGLTRANSSDDRGGRAADTAPSSLREERPRSA
ncbi:MAG: hypothetical protein QF570_04190 [Myxococcota bacterium]|nr:hypothetical protein [Myxococcota bacterium]